ncbi:MAG: hypothetical protein H0X28_16145, partial [Solirubrobacterales bacterium]|nr:hypothetical protein [Solirubrobacterales bacterium]
MRSKRDRMERSFTARDAFDLLARPLGLPGAPRATRSRAPARGRTAPRRHRPARPLAAGIELLSGAIGLLWRRRGTRIALIALLIAVG